MRQFTLPNGIKCLIDNTDCHQSVTINIMFRVGSRDEPEGFHGLTHFAEHMFFKGTTKRPEARMISSEIDQYGGILNAVTDFDVTYYYVKIDYNHLEKALDILSDLLFHALFRQKDIDTEKEVVVNELKLYRNNPSRSVSIMLGETIFQQTTLEHDVGGDIDTIRGATRDKFLAYVSHFYQPKNTIVSVVGRIPMGEAGAIKLLSRYFNQPFNYSKMIKKNSEFANYKFRPDRQLFPKFHSIQQKCRFRYRQMSHLEGSYMIIGFPGWKYQSPEYYQMLVLSTILGRGMSSRLFVEVREKQGLCYTIKADVETYQDLGIFTIYCAAHAHDIRKTFQSIWKELENLKKGKLGTKELNKAKDHLTGSEMLSRESTSYLAQMAAYDLLYLGKISEIGDFAREVSKVTIDKVIKLAKVLFQKKKLNVSVISQKKISYQDLDG